MLKGVHKRVIEVKGDPNAYFEKAVLFVRPDCQEESSRQLSLAAEEYLKAAVLSKKSKGVMFQKLAVTIGMFAAGCLLTIGVFLLL